ncbi:hypothetical protein L218DRAFT_1003169, partial [Marasmius fiardii PR-910]
MSTIQSARSHSTEYHDTKPNQGSALLRAEQGGRIHSPYPMRVPTGERENSSPLRPGPPIPDAKGKGKDPIFAPEPVRLPMPHEFQFTKIPSVEGQKNMKFTTSAGIPDPGATAENPKVNLTQTVDWGRDRSTLSTAEFTPHPQHSQIPLKLESDVSTIQDYKASVKDFKRLVHELQRATRDEFRNIGTKFSLDLTDTRRKSDKRFEIISSLATALSESLSTTDTEPKSSAVEQKSHVNIEPTAQLIEDQIRRKHAEAVDCATQIQKYRENYKGIVGDSPESNGPSFYYQQPVAVNTVQPGHSTSKVQMIPEESSASSIPDVKTSTPNPLTQVHHLSTTSARRNEHVNNPQPRSLCAATVVNVPDEEIVYPKTDAGIAEVKAPPKASEPVYYPPEVASSGAATKWTDR